MNTNTIENFEIADKNIISTSATIQFMYMLYLVTYFIMIYSFIRMVNYMRTDAYFNIKEKDISANEIVAAVASANEIVAAVASSEKDVKLWYTSEDGKCRYKGEWKNGLPNGKGIKHFYNSDSYIDGNFVDGFAEGYGKQTYEQTWEKTQPYYEGEFKRNTYNGKGAYYYGDGDYYKGEWKDGKYHGQGAAYNIRLDRTWVGEYYNDKKVEGNWVRGEI
jgi:hypothetical protein